MKTSIRFVFSFILLYGTISAEEMDANLHSKNEIITTTEWTKAIFDAKRFNVRAENSPITAEEDVDINPKTLESDKTENIESLSDFDDLEYGRSASNDEDDFVDEDRVTTELDKVDDSRKNIEALKEKISEKTDSALEPVTEATVRAGENIELGTDATDRSGIYSNEKNEASSESNPERRILNFDLVNHEDKFAQDYTHFRAIPKNPLYTFGRNFGRFSSQPFHPTSPPVSNGFHAPLHSFAAAQNSNSYNYMNKSPKDFDYLKSYETSNSYPYIGHRNNDFMPLMPYNMFGSLGQDYYKRIAPRLHNSYSNVYSNTNNYGTQPFRHRTLL